MYTDNTWVLNGQKQKKKKIIVAIEGLTWIDVCTSLWKLTCSTHPTDYFKLLSFVSPEMFVKPLCCSVGFIEVSPTHTVNRSLFVCVFFLLFFGETNQKRGVMQQHEKNSLSSSLMAD